MKLKPQIIHLNPYPFDLLVFIGTPVDKLKKWIAHHFAEDVVSDPHMFEFPGSARTIMTSGGVIILWTKNRLDTPENIGFLVHEAFHAVEFLYNKIGIKHNVESGEAWAYMMQYIVAEVLGK